MDYPTENSFALLQTGLFLATLALFIFCLMVHNVTGWFRTPLYGLTVWCFITLVCSHYLKPWINDAMGILMILVAITTAVGASINYRLPTTDKHKVQGRILFGFAIALLLLLGFGYFAQRKNELLEKTVIVTEKKVDGLKKGQAKIEAKIDTVAKVISKKVIKDSLDRKAQLDAEAVSQELFNGLYK